MTAPLSDDARAIAGGLFGSPLPVVQSLRFERPDQISARAEAALAELVDAGVLSCTVTDRAVTYVGLVDCHNFYDWLRAEMHTGVGSFNITTARGAG